MTLTVRVSFQYRQRYDQAGVLVHLNADTWAKASIEHENDVLSRLGSVVTNSGYSDWATRDIPSTGQMWYRVSRRGPDFRFEAGPDGSRWEQLRIFTCTASARPPRRWVPRPCYPTGRPWGSACTPAARRTPRSRRSSTRSGCREPSVWQPHTG